MDEDVRTREGQRSASLDVKYGSIGGGRRAHRTININSKLKGPAPPETAPTVSKSSARRAAHASPKRHSPTHVARETDTYRAGQTHAIANSVNRMMATHPHTTQPHRAGVPAGSEPRTTLCTWCMGRGRAGTARGNSRPSDARTHARTSLHATRPGHALPGSTVDGTPALLIEAREPLRVDTVDVMPVHTAGFIQV
jgi:hypothetical protein